MALGTGLDAPDPDGAGLEGLTIMPSTTLTADADDTFPADWEAQLDGWPRPVRSDLFEIVYTSGTTSAPKGVMLTHGNMLSTVELCVALLPPRHLRVVSLLPLSHLFEQAPVLHVRHDDRRRGDVRPVAQPAGHLRGAPGAARQRP